MICNVPGHGGSSDLEQLLHDAGDATQRIEFTCPACGQLGIDKLSCETYASYLKQSLFDQSDTMFPCNACYLFIPAYEYMIDFRRLNERG